MRNIIEILLSGGNYLILDTETTGLRDAEICQIAIIDSRGNTLLDTLVKPIKSIPADAVWIHGITNKRVVDAPTWDLVSQRVESLILGKPVIIYNAGYDQHCMESADRHSGIEGRAWKEIPEGYYCAMLAYAEFYGDWNDYRGSYRWQRLTDACRKVSRSKTPTALWETA